MSIKMSCVECKQKMVDGVLEHLDSCSAAAFRPITGYGMTPPATLIEFDTPAERKKFYKGLNSSSGYTIPSDTPKRKQDLSQASNRDQPTLEEILNRNIKTSIVRKLQDEKNWYVKIYGLDQAIIEIQALIDSADKRGEKRGVAIANLDAINRMRAIDGREPLTIEDIEKQLSNNKEGQNGR